MRYIDWEKSKFKYHKMMPTDGGNLTSLWGRNLVNNFANSFGIIGTVVIEPEQIVSFGLQLTKQFQYPPHIYLYYKVGTQTTLTCNPCSNPLGAIDSNFDSNPDTSSVDWTRTEGKVWAFIEGDGVRMFNSYRNQTVTVFYRIHGV